MRGPSSSTDSARIAVIGAGPAGCAAAIRLARLGYAVQLVDGGGPGRPLALESASPALVPLLDALGVDANDAGVRPSTGTRVRWAAATETIDAGSPGLRVERALFDAALRRSAAQAGAVLLSARARPPQRGAGGGWQVELHDGRCLGAAGLVLATGRAGRAMPGLRPTAALCGQWPATPRAPAYARGDRRRLGLVRPKR
jgi:flavin-dependent dehydrogenase